MTGIHNLCKMETFVLALVLSLLFFAGGAQAAMLQQWVASYNGPANNWESAYDVATDAAGDTYVTGYSNDGTSTPDVFIAKYDPTGTQLWAQRWDGMTHETDSGVSIAVDADGNAYVAGTTESSAQFDALLLKYDTNGNYQWEVIYDGGSGNDGFIRVALDGQGNVYAVGSTFSAISNLDYLVAKYSSAGVQQWLRTNNGPGNSADYATGIAVDSNGNVYVNGQQTSAVGLDVALVYYDASGTFQWKKFLTGTLAGSLDYGGGVVVNSVGNAYFTGMLQDTGTIYDLGVAGIDAANTTFWQQSYDGPFHGNELIPEFLVLSAWVGPGVRDVAIGPNDSVYTTGTVTNVGPNYDMGLIKYDSTGAQQWVTLFNNSGTYPDYAASLAVDANGTSFVTGFTTTDGTYLKYLTLMIDASGTVLDSQLFSAPGNQHNKAQNIALDPDGNPVVTGYGWQGAMEAYNAYTVKYCVGCLISNVCYPDGMVSGDNACLICDVATSQTGWTNNDGGTCDDSVFCNGADTCSGGTCSQHAGNPCGLYETCDETNDQCVPTDDDTAVDDDTADDDTAVDDDATDDDTTDDDAADDDASQGESGGGGGGGCGC